jgi:hypothetical protein
LLIFRLTICTEKRLQRYGHSTSSWSQ